MENNEEKKLVCSHCGSTIKEDDDFCPDCGTLLAEFVKCNEHKDKEAEGVCVICCNPFCAGCGIYVNEIFLCNEHSEYEIYEGMARVYGSSDSTQIEYAKSCLEQNELHPFIYSRKRTTLHMGGTDYSMFNASGEFDGHLVNEIKLMIPFQELIRAEEILDELNILEE